MLEWIHTEDIAEAYGEMSTCTVLRTSFLAKGQGDGHFYELCYG